MNKYFSVQPEAYESTRLALDLAIPIPPGETIYEPLKSAPKNAEGNVLISIRSEHCEIEPFKSAVESLIGSGAAVEISEPEFLTNFINVNGERPVLV
jgi:hypothetical protein